MLTLTQTRRANPQFSMPIDSMIQIFHIRHSHDDLNMEKNKHEVGIFHCTYHDAELSQQKTESAQHPQFFCCLILLFLILLDL